MLCCSDVWLGCLVSGHAVLFLCLARLFGFKSAADWISCKRNFCSYMQWCCWSYFSCVHATHKVSHMYCSIKSMKSACFQAEVIRLGLKTHMEEVHTWPPLLRQCMLWLPVRAWQVLHWDCTLASTCMSQCAHQRLNLCWAWSSQASNNAASEKILTRYLWRDFPKCQGQNGMCHLTSTNMACCQETSLS